MMVILNAKELELPVQRAHFNYLKVFIEYLKNVKKIKKMRIKYRNSFFI